MAKIDVSKIEGFDTMTPEQKLEALQGFEFPDPDYTGYVKKDLYDKAASDVAAWKKKHHDLLSEDERKKQEEAEKWTAMEQELEGLKRKRQFPSTRPSWFPRAMTKNWQPQPLRLWNPAIWQRFLPTTRSSWKGIKSRSLQTS